MTKVGSTEEKPTREAVELYTKAWEAISKKAQQRLIALGVALPIDLFAARDSAASGGILFKGKLLEGEDLDAYWEFFDARIEEVRHSSGLARAYRSKKKPAKRRR